MSEGSENAKEWLVRTHLNVISGPFAKEEVAALITAGKLDLNDEVCLSSGYWIYLSEREEIARQLGVEVPFDASEKEDTTETGSITETRTREIEASLKNLPEGGTSVVSGLSTRAEPPMIPERFRVKERTSLYRIFAWVLFGAAVYLLIRVLEVLGR